jgi:hypothetical protein
MLQARGQRVDERAHRWNEAAPHREDHVHDSGRRPEIRSREARALLAKREA